MRCLTSENLKSLIEKPVHVVTDSIPGWRGASKNEAARPSMQPTAAWTARQQSDRQQKRQRHGNADPDPFSADQERGKPDRNGKQPDHYRRSCSAPVG
jgi:hypothetical protein